MGGPSRHRLVLVVVAGVGGVLVALAAVGLVRVAFVPNEAERAAVRYYAERTGIESRVWRSSIHGGCALVEVLAGERGVVSVAVLERDGRWVLARVADGSTDDWFDPDNATSEQGCREVAAAGDARSIEVP
jgi:hypothetical protein